MGDLTIPTRTIPAEQFYQMNHPERGRAIIFNQQEFDADTKRSPRNGSDTDAKSIKAQLTALGFTAEIMPNMNALEMRTLLRDTGIDVSVRSNDALKALKRISNPESAVDHRKASPMVAKPTRSQFVFSNTTGLLAPDYTYSTRGLRRDICLILSVDQFDVSVDLPPRQCSDIDAKNMERILTQLHFQCYISHNPGRREMKRFFGEIASEDHSKEDCFACVILSHGDDGGIIYARDGKVKLDDLLAPFKGDVCPMLLGKPKIFFIQACRGTKKDPGVRVMADGHVANESSVQRIPIEADFLLAFAVIPGYSAWRNPVRGSWFIQALAKMLGLHGSSLDLLTILTRVCHEVAFNYESNTGNTNTSEKKQMPGIVSMLTKDVYFIPKSPQPSQ